MREFWIGTAVFAAFTCIATAMKGGITIDHWLKRDGKRFNLPATVKALDARWLVWLAAARSAKPVAAS